MNKSKNNVNRDVNYKDSGTRVGKIVDKSLRNGILNNNFIKRCGYLLAAIKISEFIKLGGSKINNSELYYIEKKYDGTPTGEVCAILGIRKKELLELIKSDKSKIVDGKVIEDIISSIENNLEEKKRENKFIKESFHSLNKIDKIYEIRDNKVFKIEDKNGNILYDKQKDDNLLKHILLENKTDSYKHYNRYENLNEDKILYSNNSDSDNEEKDSSTILNIIKNFNGFNSIDNIKNLNIDNIIDPIIHFIDHIIQFEDDYLFIFNIEPKGQTKRQLKYYPNPNICIPGGNMEKKDLLSYELCAIREFEEETGIKIRGSDSSIRNNYEILMTYNIQIKKYKSNKELNSFKNNRRSVPGNNSQKYIEKSCSFPTSTFFKRFDLKDIKYQYERHYFFVKIN